MRGIPKHFNTEQDVINSLAEDAPAAKAALQSLLEGRFAWFEAGELAAGAPGLEDENHRVIGTEEEGITRRRQYERREDPAAWMFRIGLTVGKIQEYLES